MIFLNWSITAFIIEMIGLLNDDNKPQGVDLRKIDHMIDVTFWQLGPSSVGVPRCLWLSVVSQSVSSLICRLTFVRRACCRAYDSRRLIDVAVVFIVSEDQHFYCCVELLMESLLYCEFVMHLNAIICGISSWMHFYFRLLCTFSNYTLNQFFYLLVCLLMQF